MNRRDKMSTRQLQRGKFIRRRNSAVGWVSGGNG